MLHALHLDVEVSAVLFKEPDVWLLQRIYDTTAKACEAQELESL